MEIYLKDGYGQQIRQLKTSNYLKKSIFDL